MTYGTDGFVVSVLIFGAALGALIGGRLSDQHGASTTILRLAGVFALGTNGCLPSPGWEVLAGLSDLPLRAGPEGSDDVLERALDIGERPCLLCRILGVQHVSQSMTCGQVA